MTVPVRLELPVRVRFDECGPDGAVRDAALLRYAQDLAWAHSEAAGFTREWYAAHGLIWLARCLELNVLGPAHSSQQLAVSTEVVGWRRVWARRESRVRDASGGAVLATVRTDWVLLGQAGQPVRVPPVIVAAFPTHLPRFEPARVALPPTPSAALRSSLRVRRHEVDALGHANHAVYLDWLEEAVADAGGAEPLARRPRNIGLEYVRPALPELPVSLATWPSGAEAWACRMTDAEGGELLRGELRTG